MMITVSLPSQGSQGSFQTDTLIDLRESVSQPPPGAELVWLVLPVFIESPVSDKRLADTTPTHLEFSFSHLRNRRRPAVGLPDSEQSNDSI